MRVLFLAAEAVPYIKIGGLGDVAGSLPVALRRLGVDVQLVLPKHEAMQVDPSTLRRGADFDLAFAGENVTVQVFRHERADLPVWLLDAPPLHQPPEVYAADAALDTRKYAFFSRAALKLAETLAWQPDIVHAQDWHTALAVFLAACFRREQAFWRRTATLLTIHNLPFMGADVSAFLPADLCPPERPLTLLPEWARSLPLPLGLLAADGINTVSPGYAHEMLSGALAAGLQDFLQSRRADVTGILNGIDTVSFDPANDPHLAVNYDVETLARRSENKRTLQKELGLPVRDDLPLLGLVSRMDVQKGIDLVYDALPFLEKQPWQAVLLGSGDPKLEAGARQLAARYPNRVRAVTRYDAALARRIYAGADFFLMPSRYEPCGLSQMIAMRYGALPIVHATGGLRDTVREGETGFVMQSATGAALAGTLRRALRVYAENPSLLRRMQVKAMQQDFSWQRSAEQYVRLYEKLAAQRQKAGAE